MKRKVILFATIIILAIGMFVLGGYALKSGQASTVTDCGCNISCAGGKNCSINCPTGKAAYCECDSGLTGSAPPIAKCYCR